MKKTVWIIAALLILLLVLAPALSRSLSPRADDSETEEQQDLAPDISVTTREGETVTLRAQLGKPVVINFWATWCPPCRRELPHFEKAFQNYGEEIVFMMVDLADGSRETEETLSAFLDENGYSFPVLLDLDLSAAQAYNINSIPLTVFINAEGQLVQSRIGAMSEDELFTNLNALIQK